MLSPDAKPLSRLWFSAILGWCSLASGLALWPALGNSAAYASLVAGLIGGLFAFNFSTLQQLLRAPWVLSLQAAFVLLAIAFLLQPTGQSVPYIGDFVFFALAPVLGLALASLGKSLTLERLCWLLLVAVAGACLVGLLGLMRGEARPTAPNLSPIHFADLSVTIGFMALATTLQTVNRRNVIFFLAPILGTIAAIASGTRAALPIALVLGALYGVLKMRQTSLPIALKILIPTGLLVTIAALFVFAYLAGYVRPLESVVAIWDVLSDDPNTDSSTAYRLEMYRAGFMAFLDAPIFGHGWRHQLEAALPYLSEFGQDGYFRERWAYLHNDALSFLVGAGLVGLIAYALIMVTPYFAYARAGSRRDAGAHYLVVTFIVGIAAGGLTDVLFMVEMPKMLVVIIAASTFMIRDRA